MDERETNVGREQQVIREQQVTQEGYTPGDLATPAPQTGDLRMVEFQQLDTSFAVAPDEEEHERRSLMTLLVSPKPSADRLT